MSTQTQQPEPAATPPVRRSRFSLPPAFTYPAFRTYWIGTLAAVLGFQMFNFAQLWLMHELESAPIFLGYVGLAQAAPAVALNLFGGVFADRVDRRTLIVVTQLINAALILLLAVLTVTGLVEVWHILAVALAAGAVNAFDQPARQAIFPHLIERKAMVSAVAMTSVIWQSSRIVSPAIAGIIIAALGTDAVFFISAAGFIAMTGVMLRLKVPHVAPQKTSSPAKDLLEGVKFIKANNVFSFLIGMSFFNSFFGLAYILMMPVFAVEVLHVGSRALGFLMALNGAGALLTTLVLSAKGNPGKKGLMIIGGGAMYGLSIIAFALTAKYLGSYPLSLLFMFLAGIANSLFMVPLMSVLQILVPDAMRGCVMGFFGLTYNIMPLGGLFAGGLATFIGAPFAVALGAAAVAAFALGPAMANRKVRNIDGLLEEHEAARAQAQRSMATPQKAP